MTEEYKQIKKYETTIIELFEEKDGIKDFMELDFDLNSEMLNNKYINKSIYVLQYPNYEKVVFLMES